MPRVHSSSQSPRTAVPLWAFSLLTGVLLVAIFSATVVRYRSTLREEIRRTILDRDAAVLSPVALRQLAARETGQTSTEELLAAVLESAQQQNILAMAVYDADGRLLRYAPDSLLFAELPLSDYARLLTSEKISRYDPAFPLDRYFAGFGVNTPDVRAPVLEVLLPLHGRDPSRILGFAQYYIDARPLSKELATIDARVNRLTALTLIIGGVLIAAVLATATLLLQRAQTALAERNERLLRASFELTLAAKASALGQIMSHLVHGLQGPVAGLRAVVSSRGSGEEPDWQSAADYADRLQSIIAETVALLHDTEAPVSYSLTPQELVDTIRRRTQANASDRAVTLDVLARGAVEIDSHRGGLLCLIATNLIQNAILATPARGVVRVGLRTDTTGISLDVSDTGTGIPPELQERLFIPGTTGRPGGTGLGLAISRLLARQLGGELTLLHTGPEGTAFRVTMPQSSEVE